MDHDKKTHFQVQSFLNPCSSSTPTWTYDVFLSFRGEDTRNSFTDHLYTALVQAGIRTFRDDHELQRGQEISSELLRAIEESRISIIVFSKNYAVSRWCLDELVKIMKCKKEKGQLVLPVFYDVDPSDVRKQAGSFADAFARHEQFLVTRVVEKWREVLTEAAGLSGWDLQIAASRSNAKFIKDIVTYVLHLVNQTYLHVAKYPVGLDSRIGILRQLLDIESNDVHMIGIFGMGGIGKTTIAKHIYNSFFSEFETRCFLANVRERSKQPNGTVHLQEQLLMEMLRQGEIKVGNIHRGISILQERLRGKKVLIVLDDVDQIEQLETLVGQGGWFAAGSRIMITTRDMHLLDEAGVEIRYEIEGLNLEESLRLFSWHAFGQPVPLRNYGQLSQEIVSCAGGLPLALELVGSSLVKRNLDYWKCMLKKLKEVPPNKILKILKLSYDSLGHHTEKDIFLDIACFFIGMDEEYAIKIFDACGFHGKLGIETLKDKCLLKTSSDHRLQMHDLIRDMGREIVRHKFPEAPEKHTRLWQNEVICDLLTNDELRVQYPRGTEAIEAIILDLPLQKHFSTRPFAMMPNLRLLQINNVILDGSFEGCLKKLRWLCWHKCPLKSLPCEFHPAKLVSLDMQISNLNMLWQGKKALSDLKILNLSGSEDLTTIPDLSGVPNLEELRLSGCLRLSNIHVSIGCLDKLITLNLEECKNLKSLPQSIGHLRSLEELNLCGCSVLEELPEELGNLQCLKRLNASYSWIKQLPDSIGLLHQLYHLDLDGCENLKSLPSSICNLQSLERLRFEDCSDVEELPENLGVMKGLQQIYACGSGINRLPDSIGSLAQLYVLCLVNCKSLKSLPASICHLRSLDYLYLKNCTNLERLPEQLGYIECLREIQADGTAIEELPDSIGLLRNLKHLSLRDCKQLRSLPSSLWNLLALEQLSLSGCSNLTTLDLDGYGSLQPVLEFPPNLPHATLHKLPKPCNLDLKNFSRLVVIDLRGCSSLSITTFESFLSQRSSVRPCASCVIYIPRIDIPECFEYQGLWDSSISFNVPSDVLPDSLHLTVWVNYAFRMCESSFKIRTRNSTSGEMWDSYVHGRPFEVGSCVMHITPMSQIKSGDRIVISCEQTVEVACGLHLAYTKKGGNGGISFHILEDQFRQKRRHDSSPVKTDGSMIKLSKKFKP